MRTERLAIEVLAPEHADLLFDDLQDPRIYTYIPEPPPGSVESLRARYRQLAAGLPPERAELWLNWVLFRIGDHRPVGWLQATVLPLEQRADVAWVLFPHAWRQGYATEGTRWMLEHLRTAHGVRRATAEIDTRNAASIALADRLGFVFRDTVATSEGHDHVYERSLV